MGIMNNRNHELVQTAHRLLRKLGNATTRDQLTAYTERELRTVIREAKARIKKVNAAEVAIKQLFDTHPDSPEFRQIGHVAQEAMGKPVIFADGADLFMYLEQHGALHAGDLR